MTDIDDIRFRVRETLTKEFGDDFARDLMSLTPPFNWTDIATKSDVAAVKAELTVLEVRVDARFAVSDANMNRRFAELSQEFQSAMRSQTIALSAIFGGLMAVMTTSLSLVAFYVR